MGHLQSWLLPRTIPSLEQHITNAVNVLSRVTHRIAGHIFLQLDILTLQICVCPDMIYYYCAFWSSFLHKILYRTCLCGTLLQNGGHEFLKKQ